MKSRITIEVDFDNGQPYIRVIEDPSSDDVRDKLITFFRQRLGHASNWCRVEFSPGHDEINQSRAWRITPIIPEQMEKEANEMANAAHAEIMWKKSVPAVGGL